MNGPIYGYSFFRRAISIFPLLLAISPLTVAQELLPGQTRLFDQSGGMITEIPFATKDDFGSLFISDEWQSGTIELSNGLIIDQYLFKYEIVKGHFELKTTKGIKILPGDWVKKFQWQETAISEERKFVNAGSFFQDGIPFIGFFEILYQGEVTLLSRVQGEEVEPNYVPQFDMGSKDKRYAKNERFYLVKQENTVPLGKKNKQNLPIFDENASQVADYLKKNRLKFNRKEDIIRVIEYYDFLISSSN